MHSHWSVFVLLGVLYQHCDADTSKRHVLRKVSKAYNTALQKSCNNVAFMDKEDAKMD
ncbi:hypothetical protein AAVH_38831, partial [Aphelenchoides avenae]